MSHVDTEVRRLIDLSNALLDLEQLGSGEPAHREDTGLDGLVRSVTDRYQAAAARDGRSLTVRTAGAVVSVDPRWLEPAIANLVGNALRHGRGAVRVEAEADSGRLRLWVTDEGPGFPPDFLPRAFDRFARAEASRTSPGAGLGLALVAAVAESHDGAVRAENTAQGAVVTLDLPC
jgi:signal transduction histidine kinase